MAAQLPLDLRLECPPRLEDFIPGDNAEALAAVRRCLAGDEPYVYLWGSTGSGRSHLLAAAAASREGLYLAAADLSEAPEAGEDLPALVCVDDIQELAGDAALEGRLFTWFNRLRDEGRGLLVSGDRPAGQLPIALPDLASRLAWGPGYRLRPLDDGALGQWLQQSARQRGIDLGEAAIRYILYRFPRDPVSLVGLLERIDRASLAAQRRPSIPLIRRVLETGEIPTSPETSGQVIE